MSGSRKSSRKSIHFIGIGGIGMSALSRHFLVLANEDKKGPRWLISGSDASRSVLTQELVKEGIKVKIGHKKDNITSDVKLVIYNRAIPRDNPELVTARLMHIPTMPYAKALGRITKNYSTIAITGSHGKSTTTALAALALLKCGLDPTVLIGTKLKELHGKNMRMGKGQYLVLEADDFGGAFLEYSPAISIVTNIDKEHMDFYKNFSNVKRAFLTFLSTTRRDGVLILNRDDKPLHSLKASIARIAKKKHLKVLWYSTKNPESKKVQRAITIPGQHNISNALAVLQIGKVLKAPEKKVLAAIGSYKGAWRRMEYKGTLKIKGVSPKVMVYDDYAHHPTEIKATLSAFKDKFPRSPLICVFQPHQAQRLELLFKEFTQAFDAADAVFILPLYKVLGRDEKLKHDSEALVRALKKRSPKDPIFYVPDPKKIKDEITATIANMSSKRSSHPPVLVMMGAGDIADLTSKLVQ
jgi:UDP-N-acetylmuramate--alanine ligase